MPRRDEHLARAIENEKLALSLRGAGASSLCNDWAITMLFYSAVHWIDGYLALKNQRPKNHLQRDTVVETNGSLADIYRQYRRLKDMSERARYEVACYGNRDWDVALQKHAAVKEHVARKL